MGMQCMQCIPTGFCKCSRRTDFSNIENGGVGKWVPASAGKAKAGMVHSVSRCTRGVQVKLWDPLRTRAIPERLRGVFTTRRYTNQRLPLPYLRTSPPFLDTPLRRFIQLRRNWYTAIHSLIHRHLCGLAAADGQSLDSMTLPGV